MEGMTREALRLECLKLAVQVEFRTGVENVKLCAETMFEWVLAGKETPATQAKKAAK